nr:retrovirus-related Pol polyprotein from transposon TNT 1-94 [Tanacetum cinerariifolium]
FNLTTLPLSFWDYALESTVRILNMVSTKKVDKTPYEIWHGKTPNLSYLKVWGCEAYVKRDSPDKLYQRSVKCIFVGYPKETMGYYFYFPHKNKVIVARYRNFLERDLISQKFSGRDNDLEDDHMDTLPSENTSKILVEPESLGSPSELIPVSATFDPDKVIWQGTMDEKMNFMKVMKVWIVVDLPPNAKVVRSKWLYKKKTDMDGKVHTYKARLVAKGYTQTYGIDYEETFSPTADIRAIRILIAIAAYYDYEIWQMDVKTAFLNGRLDEDIYMEQPEGYVDPKYPNHDVACLMLSSMSPDLQRTLEKYGAKTIAKLYAMLKLHEKGIPKKAETPVVLAIQEGKIQKDKKKPQRVKSKDKRKNKFAYASMPKIPPPPKIDNLAKDSICHHCKEGYAYESAARILNMVPTKKVERSPYEIWHGKAPIFMLQEMSESHGLLEMSRSDKGLELIQEEGDLNKPPNYKDALADLKYDKWLGAINAEMQSMKDNQVLYLVDLPSNDRTVESRWLFKKTTEMDGNFDEEIKKISFTQNPDEPCVYLKASGSNVAFLILEVAYILGIKIIRDRSKWLIALSQNSYLEKILKKFRMDNSKKGYTPMMENPGYRKSQGARTPNEMLCNSEPVIAIANDPGILKGARHFHRKYHYIHEVIQERHTNDNVANPFTKPMPFNKHYEHAMAIVIVPASSLMQIRDVLVSIRIMDVK